MFSDNDFEASLVCLLQCQAESNGPQISSVSTRRPTEEYGLDFRSLIVTEAKDNMSGPWDDEAHRHNDSQDRGST